MEIRTPQAEISPVTERQRAVYRDCASIAIQVSELREEVKECISGLMLGFHCLAQSVLQHRAEKSAHMDAAMKQLSTHLHILKDFVKEQSLAIQQAAAPTSGSEARLVHQLHAAVLRLLSSSTRDKLHRSSDFSLTAPLSWNTCDSLSAAVPFAITALEACADTSKRISESNQILSIRQEAQERKIQQLEDELMSIKRDVAELVAQSSRDGLKTDAPLFGIANDSIGALLKQLKANVHYQSGLSLPVSSRGHHPETRLRVEVVKPHVAAENPFKEAVLRNQNARLRFRLAIAMVLKDLMKFRCRRSLAVSAFHYRKLRVKLQELTVAANSVSVTHATKIAHPTPPSTSARENASALGDAWRSSLQATPPTCRTKSAKTRSFQQYVETLGPHDVTQSSARRNVLKPR
jgi:hypothetical protein